MKNQIKKLEEQQIFYKNIRKADFLFSRLGYTKQGHYKNVFYWYKNRKGSHIYFDCKNKTIDVSGRTNKNKILTLCQIDAINKKIVELGWLNKI